MIIGNTRGNINFVLKGFNLTPQPEQILLRYLELTDFILEQIIVIKDLLVELLNHDLQFVRLLILLLLEARELILIESNLALYFFI